MPDFDKLHRLSSKLAALTKPGDRQEGLSTWCVFVGETWRDIAGMWDEPADSLLSDLWNEFHREFPTCCMQDTTVGQLYVWARNRRNRPSGTGSEKER